MGTGSCDGRSQVPQNQLGRKACPFHWAPCQRPSVRWRVNLRTAGLPGRPPGLGGDIGASTLADPAIPQPGLPSQWRHNSPATHLARLAAAVGWLQVLPQSSPVLWRRSRVVICYTVAQQPVKNIVRMKHYVGKVILLSSLKWPFSNSTICLSSFRVLDGLRSLG